MEMFQMSLLPFELFQRLNWLRRKLSWFPNWKCQHTRVVIWSSNRKWRILTVNTHIYPDSQLILCKFIKIILCWLLLQTLKRQDVSVTAGTRDWVWCYWIRKTLESRNYIMIFVSRIYLRTFSRTSSDFPR